MKKQILYTDIYIWQFSYKQHIPLQMVAHFPIFVQKYIHGCFQRAWPLYILTSFLMTFIELQ